jgi:hypothetical protein
MLQYRQKLEQIKRTKEELEQARVDLETGEKNTVI